MKVSYIDHMGSDLSVVNNARVSFANESKDLSDRDIGLICFLARGMTSGDWNEIADDIDMGLCLDPDALMHRLKSLPTHWAPFANGTNIQLHVKAPIPIMRQVFKTKVGTVESEISRRYVSGEPEVFYPKLRGKAENVKQGSGEELTDSQSAHAETVYDFAMDQALACYRELLGYGVCPEQARFVLPQAMMTEARITNSLYGWWSFYNQRSDPHAQREVQILAEQVRDIIEPLFPHSWNALETY